MSKTYKQKITRETIENEIIDDYVDVKLPKKHQLNNGGFITIFQKAMLNIAMLSNLSKLEYKLLLYLIGTAGVDNSVSLDLDIISSELSEKKPNVSTALKALVTRNVVLRKDGYRYGNNPLPFELRLNYDQINYDLAYNGKVKEFKNVHLKHPQIQHEPTSNQLTLDGAIKDAESEKSKEQIKLLSDFENDKP